tara:strand:+ start:176 stop:520 length:345 start_codon:yes stop_codon:yes gene_type:complete
MNLDKVIKERNKLAYNLCQEDNDYLDMLDKYVELTFKIREQEIDKPKKNKIKIDGIEGYYYIENNELIYLYSDTDEVQVSDLSDLTVYQYNQLAMSINAAYPDYNIKEIEGRFI